MIPRLKLTIIYIMQELEELEREETFRLKRVKEKHMTPKDDTYHVCHGCLAYYKSSPRTKERLCPRCLGEPHEVQKLPSPITVEVQKEPSPIKVEVSDISAAKVDGKPCIEQLMTHLNEFINKTKQYNTVDVLSSGLDEFLKSCCQVKEKIQEYAHTPCETCRETPVTCDSTLVLSEKPEALVDTKSECISPRVEPGTSSKQPPSTQDIYSLSSEPESKFGVFEKKFKEVIKLTRLQNDDGSVSEEKKVITVKIEKRNPKPPNAKKDPVIAYSVSGSGLDANSGFGRSSSLGKERGEGSHVEEKSCSIEEDNNCDVNHLDCKGQDSRQVKSDVALCSGLKGHPRIRSCMSASAPTAIKSKNAATSCGSNSCSLKNASKVTLPPEPSKNDIKPELNNNKDDKQELDSQLNIKKVCHNPQASKTSAGKTSMCCINSLPFTGGFESGKSSQVEVETCKPVSMSSSAQTCFNETPLKSTADKWTCMPECTVNKKPTDKVKTVSIATNSLWRDVWTSTSDLVTIPSKLRKKKSSLTLSPNEPSAACQKPSLKKPDNCCTIKIISRTSKDCADSKTGPSLNEKLEEPKEISRSSLLDALKRIFMPSSRSVLTNEPKQGTSTQPDLKPPEKSCLTRLRDYVSSVSLSSSKSCKACEARIELKTPSNTSLNTTCSCASWKSAAVGSVKSRATTPASIHSQAYSCSCESVYSNTCCDLAQTMSKASTCLPGHSPLDSKPVLKASSKSVATSTKLCDRYDVRPYKNIRGRTSCHKETQSNCTCCSESCFVRNRPQYCKPVCSRSFYEDDCCYFKWN